MRYFIEFKPQDEDIKKRIEGMIEPDNLHFISPIYQSEKAINEYYSMKFTHCQGESYRNLIENMNYLNDNFHDDLYHFAAVLERFKWKYQRIDHRIESLKNRNRNSHLYKHFNYLEEALGDWELGREGGVEMDESEG